MNRERSGVKSRRVLGVAIVPKANRVLCRLHHVTLLRDEPPNAGVNGALAVEGHWLGGLRVNSAQYPEQPRLGQHGRHRLAYGPDYADLFRRAASYADRLLKGTKPADLPVEQPAKFELVVNLKTAKALGIKVPPSILLRADRVIE